VVGDTANAPVMVATHVVVDDMIRALFADTPGKMLDGESENVDVACPLETAHSTVD